MTLTIKLSKRNVRRAVRVLKLKPLPKADSFKRTYKTFLPV